MNSTIWRTDRTSAGVLPTGRCGRGLGSRGNSEQGTTQPQAHVQGCCQDSVAVGLRVSLSSGRQPLVTLSPLPHGPHLHLQQALSKPAEGRGSKRACQVDVINLFSSDHKSGTMAIFCHLDPGHWAAPHSGQGTIAGHGHQVAEVVPEGHLGEQLTTGCRLQENLPAVKDTPYFQYKTCV